MLGSINILFYLRLDISIYTFNFFLWSENWDQTIFKESSSLQEDFY